MTVKDECKTVDFIKFVPCPPYIYIWFLKHISQNMPKFGEKYNKYGKKFSARYFHVLMQQFPSFEI